MNNEELIRRQKLPLKDKMKITFERIEEFYYVFDGRVYVSFSGGRDSTVLDHLVHLLYPDVERTFVNTGLEFPEIVDFARSFEITEIRPKMPFNQVIEKYGYPVISKENAQKISECRTTKSDKLRHKRLYGADNKYKSGKIPNKWQYLIDAPFKISHKCCDIMKKNPIKKFEKETGKHSFIGTMAKDSHLRRQKYIRNGCNNFDGKIESTPLGFWTHKDILEYIETFHISYSKLYDMGYDHSGCMFCMFGVHLEKSDMFNKNKFQLMKETHPKQYNYCINKLGCGKVLDAINVSYT